MRPSAAVFAYHDVGARGLEALLDAGVDVRLVVTHEDDPGENVWFASVAQLARARGLDVVAPAAPDEALRARIAGLHPDFIFSFYYRRMLPASFLSLARRGAYNLHGSLLPKYRGRAPVNWAILRGERETGVTLHAMTEKPDAGAIVDQLAVPIGPDETAREVFDKVTAAAGALLARALPPLLAGTARLTPQDLSRGSYCGGRRPEDGRIAWTAPARAIHDLVRAVTRPYPGAFSDTPAGRLMVWRTQLLPRSAAGAPALFVEDGALLARAGDGGLLRMLDADLAGAPLTIERLRREHGGVLELA